MSTTESWQHGFELISSNIYVDNIDERVERSSDYGHCHCCAYYDHEDDVVITCLDRSCMNFISRTECIKCPSKKCGNQRFQQKAFQAVEVRETMQKGFGLFASQDIPINALIIEYVGEVIDIHEKEERQSQYNASNKHLYMMEIDSKRKLYVDSRFKGGLARFLNHSCEPNSMLDKWIVKNRYRLGMYATRAISKDEEITFDYRWTPSFQRPPVKCYCGSVTCRGFLEKFTSEEEKFLYVRAGHWINHTDFVSQSVLYDEEGRLDPEKMIGKFIKIQREAIKTLSNNNNNKDQRTYYYEELKVKEYNHHTELYTCWNLITKENVEEDFQQKTALKWYWLDQSADQTVQKKVSISCNHSLPFLSPSSNNFQILLLPL